jgi:hypothetical protein
LTALSQSPTEQEHRDWRILYPQKNRLITVGDTSVLGSYESFKTIASYRITEREQKRYAAREIVSLREEANKARATLMRANQLIATKDETIDLQLEQIQEMADANLNLLQKNAKLRPWATIGKVFVITGTLVVVGVVAENLIDASNNQ